MNLSANSTVLPLIKKTLIVLLIAAVALVAWYFTFSRGNLLIKKAIYGEQYGEGGPPPIPINKSNSAQAK